MSTTSGGIPQFKSGDPVSAGSLDRLRVQAERVNSVLGLDSQDFAGSTIISARNVLEIWAKLTSVSSAKFAWTQQIQLQDGSWVDGSMSGTTTKNEARELWNIPFMPTNTRIRIRKEPSSNIWLFDASNWIFDGSASGSIGVRTSTTTPSSGSFYFRDWNGTAMSTTSISASLKNKWNISVTSGTDIEVKWVNGTFWLAGKDC